MEFKAADRAQEYALGKSSSPVFALQHEKDFFNGYIKAIKDTQAPEMLSMLKRIYEKKTITFDDLIAIKKLIKDTTEL